MKRHIKIGTRNSPLAREQASLIRDALCQHDKAQHDLVDIVPIITRGDAESDRRLADIGGKGLFTAELDARLNEGDLDMAVHSLKDLPTKTQDGLIIGAIVKRAPPDDVLILAPSHKFADAREALLAITHIGTASLRRQAQLLRFNPRLKMHLIRGNIGTRLEKLATQSLDATILARAGLVRMNLMADDYMVLPFDIMLPAAGQGALAVMCRGDDDDMRARLSVLHDLPSALCVSAERAFLETLDGSCRTPIAAYAHIFNGRLELSGRLLAEDGSDMGAVQKMAQIEDEAQARAFGIVAGDEIRKAHRHLIVD